MAFSSPWTSCWRSPGVHTTLRPFIWNPIKIRSVPFVLYSPRCSLLMAPDPAAPPQTQNPLGLLPSPTQKSCWYRRLWESSIGMSTNGHCLGGAVTNPMGSILAGTAPSLGSANTAFDNGTDMVLMCSPALSSSWGWVGLWVRHEHRWFCCAGGED